MKNKKILFCPAHYVYDDSDRGSEVSWAFYITNYFSNKYTNSMAVSGFANLSNKYNYIICLLQKNKNQIDLGIVNALIFNLKYSFYSFHKQISDNYKVVHHVLPFGLGVTFDIFKILFKNKKYKYVVGPIQNILPKYSDNLTDFNANKETKLNIFLSRTLHLFSNLLMILSFKTLSKADLIITIDHKVKQILVDNGIMSKKIKIISPGVNTNIFKPLNSKTYFSKKRSLNLITVSALIKRKSVNKLIYVMQILHKRKIHVNLNIIGVGPELKYLKTLTRKLNVANRVFFLGYIPHNKIYKFYQKADVFITMSKDETWGMMYLEALSSGLPVVSYSNYGANLIINNKVGFRVKSKDEFADKINLLYENSKLLKQMSSSSRDECVKLYDWNTVIFPKYDTLYKDLFS